MKREEKLSELARITVGIRNRIGSEYLPAADVRRYNQLMKELFGDMLGEDPEVQEGKEKA